MGFTPLESYREHVPVKVAKEAEALLSRAIRKPCPAPDPTIVDGWTLESFSVEYRCPPGRAGDIISSIVERTAYDELQERLEELEEDDALLNSAFIAGAPRDGAFVLVKPPTQWWSTPELEAIVREGLLSDYTYKNDACPSLGTQLRNGMILQIYTGHPHPDHYTRQDGCDPRFAVLVFYPDEGPGEPVWMGENPKEAADAVRRLIKAHGGARRAPRAI